MKFIIDMNLSADWEDALSLAGFQAVHWTAIGRPNDLDSKILAYATENDFIILTADLDFSAMLAASGDCKPSVVQLRPGNLTIESLKPILLIALKTKADELRNGALVTIDPNKSRVRTLPLSVNR